MHWVCFVYDLFCFLCHGRWDFNANACIGLPAFWDEVFCFGWIVEWMGEVGGGIG